MQTSKIVKFFESPLLILLLSAIIIPILGLAFSERQVCMVDAAAIPDRFKLLTNEFFYRDYAIWKAVTPIENKQTIPDEARVKLVAPLEENVRQIVSGEQNIYVSGEFREKSLYDIALQIQLIMKKFEISEGVLLETWKANSKSGPEIPDMNIELAQLVNPRVTYPVDFVAEFAVSLPADQTKEEEKSADFRDYLQRLGAERRFENKCDYWKKLWEVTFGSPSQIVSVMK